MYRKLEDKLDACLDEMREQIGGQSRIATVSVSVSEIISMVSAEQLEKLRVCDYPSCFVHALRQIAACTQIGDNT